MNSELDGVEVQVDIRARALTQVLFPVINPASVRSTELTPVSLPVDIERVQGALQSVEPVDWQHLNDDPFVKKLSHLPPALLYSLIPGHDFIGTWAAHALLRSPHVSFTVQDQAFLASKSKDLLELRATPESQWKGFEKAMARGCTHARRPMSYLLANEILDENGIDLHHDVLAPVKELEVAIGYYPRAISLESRINGMAIPRSVREFYGSLRFFQRARASDDAIEEFHALVLTVTAQQAHALQALKAEFKNHVGKDLPFSKNALSVNDMSPEDIEEVRLWCIDSPVIKQLEGIRTGDFGQYFFDTSDPDIKPGQLSSYLNSLLVAYMDPGLSWVTTVFNMIENMRTEALCMDSTSYYRFNQTRTALQAFARMSE
ncbi:MAG: hypothetical protein NUV98_06515 [Candidatus Roizmanbacteria bacterium]|nr:hypothetical protein [Candidatus Roizmanbacteria bacterium]